VGGNELETKKILQPPDKKNSGFNALSLFAVFLSRYAIATRSLRAKINKKDIIQKAIII
jgi:hypothetical protein